MRSRSLVLVVGIALMACAPAGERVSAARVALGAGIDDDGDPAVVALVSAERPTELRCTGTLIDPRVVLTAAHCAAQDEPASLSVSFASELDGSGTRTAIAFAVAHPEHDDSADHDLALVLLRDASPVEPIALSAETMVAAPQSVRLVGFGVTAAGAGDADRKREGESRITDVMAEHVVLGADPSLPCNGDSGGPVLATSASGEALVAVISRGDAECNAVSRATRIDAHLETFIRPMLAAWAPGSVPFGQACLYDEHCASGRCLEAIDEPLVRFCSGACATDEECAASLVCEEGQCRYTLPSPGALGAACTDHDDCVRGDCLAERRICSTRCVSGGDDCANGFACMHLGGIDFYCLARPKRSEGCAIAEGADSAAHMELLAIGLVLYALGRARSRRKAPSPLMGRGSG